MRTLLFLIQKEFIQIVRNRTMLPLIFVMPIVQLLILVFAADLNMKSIDYSVMDLDGSSTSRELLSHYNNSPFFIHGEQLFSEAEINHSLKSGEADIVLVIPAGFESALTRNEPVEVQFLVDGINTTAAVLTAVYAQNILMEFHNNLGGAWIDQQSSKDIGIQIRSHHWYNKELEFKIYMVPGILVLLVSMIGWILAALNIVREKEIGTIEQINVTPVRKYQFIIGKLIPFWIIAMFELAFGLALGRLIFGVPIVGSLGLLFLFTGVYLLAPLGIGLLSSSLSSNQQQVMFLTFFFNITFIMMSGLFTPVESMPHWAQYINYLNPLSYFMPVIRMILLKGSGFMHILPNLIGVAIYSVIVLSLATLAYRKRA